eukprot:274491-Rhodomonas_salina.1
MANSLICYAYSDHAGDQDTQCSVTGYITLLNCAAVFCIMEDLGFKQQEPTVLCEDNMACIYMSQKSIMYHKARHIDTRVSSAEQVADSLMKSTPKPAFEKHWDAMLCTSVSTIPSKTSGDSFDNDYVDEMEGIELEAEGCEDSVESGLTQSAFKVPKFKAGRCARGHGDGEPGLLLDSSMMTTLTSGSGFTMHCAWSGCATPAAEFGDFHVFPPWDSERDVDQQDMQVEGA